MAEPTSYGVIVRETWKPYSTPDSGVRPQYQVSTNGRGAVVYLDPEQARPDRDQRLATGGTVMFSPRPPKEMMDPSDRSTWQRPYRFT